MFQTQADLSTSTMLSAFFSTQQTSSFSISSGNPFTIIRSTEKRKTPYINDQPEILNPDKKLQTSSHNYATIPQKASLTEEKRTRSARTTIFEKTPKSDRVFHQPIKERPEDTINDIFSFFFNGNTSSSNLQNHAKSLIRDQPSITDFINQSENFEEFKASEVFSTPVKEAKATQAYAELSAHIALQESTAVTEQDPTPPSSPIYNEIPQVSDITEEKIVPIKTGDNYQISNAYIASLQNAPRKRREIKAKWEPEDTKNQILAKFEEQACKVLKFEVVGDEKAIKVMDEFEWDLELATKTIKKQAGKYSSALNPKFLPKYETRSNRG